MRERVNAGTWKAAVAAVVWTVAISVGIAGTVSEDVRLLFWGLMSGLVACMITGHLVACHAVRSERVNLEGLIEGLIAGAQDRSDDRPDDVTPIR